MILVLMESSIVQTELTSMGSTLFKGLVDTQEPIPDLLKDKKRNQLEEHI